MDSVEHLKQFVLLKELPASDFSLFGIRCPYCGKSDRIRKLEEPSETTDRLDATETTAYRKLWEEANPNDSSLGVCKFCQNILKLSAPQKAEPLFDFE